MVGCSASPRVHRGPFGNLELKGCSAAVTFRHAKRFEAVGSDLFVLVPSDLCHLASSESS